MKDKKDYLIILLAIVIVLGFFGLTWQQTNMLSMHGDHEHMSMDIEEMKGQLILEGEYRCCIEDPCNYCLLNWGTCDCLDEVVNGEGPCGECIGEILEGEGNRFLAPYFAMSLADEIGVEYFPELKRMISKHYDINIDDQYSSI